MIEISQHGLSWLFGLGGALLLTGVIGGTMAGLLGIGGGIVIVPVLYWLFSLLGLDSGLGMHIAVATSLATIVPTSIVSARSHYRRGSLDIELLRSLAFGIVTGVIIGTVLAGWIQGQALTTLFAVIALFVAANMAFRTGGAAIAQKLPAGTPRFIIGSLIGGFSSMMGIGGGTLSVPVLTAFNYPMRRAVGTAAAIGLLISLPGSIGLAISGLGTSGLPPASIGYVNLAGFALIVPATVVMAPIGARLAHTVNSVRLRQIFAVFLLATSLHMFMNIFGI